MVIFNSYVKLPEGNPQKRAVGSSPPSGGAPAPIPRARLPPSRPLLRHGRKWPGQEHKGLPRTHGIYPISWGSNYLSIHPSVHPSIHLSNIYIYIIILYILYMGVVVDIIIDISVVEDLTQLRTGQVHMKITRP